MHDKSILANVLVARCLRFKNEPAVKQMSQFLESLAANVVLISFVIAKRECISINATVLKEKQQ